MRNIVKRANMKIFPEKLFFGPEWLVLGVNNVCNLHCKMCDVGLQDNETNFAVNLTGTSPLNMPLELVQRIFNDAKNSYPNVKIGFAFTEPLVYPHLKESLQLAKSQGFFTSITTNALNLKQKAEDLVESGLDEICISLDGPQDIHNEIRGHKKSFQKAVEGIERLLEFNVPPKISIFCVITEWNIGHLKEFCDFFKKYPLEKIGFMHTNFTDQKTADQHNLLFGDAYPATHSNTLEINIDSMDLDLLNRELNEIKNTSYSFEIVFSPDLASLEQLEEFYLKPEILIGKGCNDIYRNIMIKSDGTVIPAHGRCYNLEIGNLYESSLKQVWNSTVISTFRKKLSEEGGLLPACSRCCSAF